MVPDDLFRRKTVHRKYQQLKAQILDLEDKLRRGRESDNIRRAVWADLASLILEKAGHDEFVRALTAERDAEIAAERAEQSQPTLRQRRKASDRPYRDSNGETEKPFRASPQWGDRLADVSMR